VRKFDSKALLGTPNKTIIGVGWVSRKKHSFGGPGEPRASFDRELAANRGSGLAPFASPPAKHRKWKGRFAEGIKPHDLTPITTGTLVLALRLHATLIFSHLANWGCGIPISRAQPVNPHVIKPGGASTPVSPHKVVLPRRFSQVLLVGHRK
jgi:hypothetical protein